MENINYLKKDDSIADHLSPALFWDVDVSNLDWDKHKQLILSRVIERGNYKELQDITAHYGIQETRDIIKKIAWLDKRDMAFVHIYFNIPLNELKCYTKKQSAPGYLH